MLSQNNVYANTDSICYDKLIYKIQHHNFHDIVYNSSKTAAIVEPEFSLPIYINFKTKQTFKITDRWPGVIFLYWKNDNLLLLKGSCGSGCARTFMFIPPATVLTCSSHAYRIENLDEKDFPDYSSNRPLLIDPKKKIYVCYDEEDNIQVFPFPTHATIRPPKGFFTEKAETKGNKLIIFYENRFGEKKQVAYDL